MFLQDPWPFLEKPLSVYQDAALLKGHEFDRRKAKAEMSPAIASLLYTRNPQVRITLHGPWNEYSACNLWARCLLKNFARSNDQIYDIIRWSAISTYSHRRLHWYIACLTQTCSLLDLQRSCYNCFSCAQAKVGWYLVSKVEFDKSFKVFQSFRALTLWIIIKLYQVIVNLVSARTWSIS